MSLQTTPVFFAKPQAWPVTASSSQVLARNEKRRFLLIQNLALANAYIQFSADALTEECIRLVPGGLIGFDVQVPINEIFARLESGTGKLAVIEA